MRFLLAGATAVEMASAVLAGGFEVLSTAIEQIEDYLKQKDIRASNLIGKAATVKKFADMPERKQPWKQFLSAG